MAKMSNRRKESIAVNAIVNETFQEGAYLVPDIPVGDKAPSFDGQITVFKNDSERKESYLNDVPTQVKGKGVPKFTNGNIKYPLDIAHYENYYKRGGCLLLVVEILESTETKIFYKQLLPTELKAIILNWGHQQKYSVELRPLNETTLYIVCRRFIDQMIKQPQILIEKNQYKDEDYEKLIFTSMTFNPEKVGVKDIFNHDFIQFGLKDNIEYPIRNMRIGTISKTSKETIIINKKEFEVNVTTKYSPPKIIKLIEDCLEINLYENKEKLDFKITKIYSLATQLKILPLLIEFLKSGEIRFSDYYGMISGDEGKQYLDELKESFSLFLELQKLFLELKVDEYVQFGNKGNNDKEKIYREIELFINIMTNKNYSNVKMNNPESPSFFKFTIGNIYIILFYNPSSENRFINAFSEEVLEMPIRMVFSDIEVTMPISPYFLLEKETLIHAKNLDFDTMIKSFDSLEYEKPELLFNMVNNFCLVCLNVFDVTKNIEILRLPDLLFNKFKVLITNDLNKKIISINLLQTKYRRQGELKHDEIKELMVLKESLESTADTVELKFCINVLLQSKIEAEILFEEFDSEKKTFYQTLPIFQLFKNLL